MTDTLTAIINRLENRSAVAPTELTKDERKIWNSFVKAGAICKIKHQGYLWYVLPSHELAR